VNYSYTFVDFYVRWPCQVCFHVPPASPHLQEGSLVAPTPSPIFSAISIACFIFFVSCPRACGLSALLAMNSHQFEVETMCFGAVQAYIYCNCWHYYGLVHYFLSDREYWKHPCCSL
jgi:hypothetical protein